MGHAEDAGRRMGLNSTKSSRYYDLSATYPRLHFCLDSRSGILAFPHCGNKFLSSPQWEFPCPYHAHNEQDNYLIGS